MWKGRSAAKSFVVGAGLLAGLGVVTIAGVAGGNTGWRCDPENRGMISATLLDGGGYSSPTEAVEARIPSLVEDTGLPKDRLDQAFENVDGPDRYDAKEEQLFIDDQLQVKFGVSALSDGTWAVGSMELCMAPPTTRPGETPQPTAGSEG